MAGRALSSSDIAPFLRTVLASTPRNIEATSKNGVRNIGVCVSGGPDSMALAYLLQGIPRLGKDKLRLSAWIVDHRARPESTIEAQQVHANLSKLGIKATILSMKWPNNIEPLRLTDFESQARTKRYQLLAYTARKYNIEHLFLGHHQDDQVETILMRLIRNRNADLKGLAGMAATSHTPETDEMFGVHGAARLSIHHRDVSDRHVRNNNDNSSGARGQMVPKASLQSLTIPGQIFIHRPLLPFIKSDLITTCELNNVPYVIDPTNKDPRTSLRNAVRYLREKYSLPLALHQRRVLELQQNAQKYLTNIKDEGIEVLSRCRILSLDLRSGVVKVLIPFTGGNVDVNEDAHAYAISKLTEIVTPNPRINHSTRFSPGLFSQLPASKDDALDTVKSFTHDKVLFSPDNAKDQVWLLSRQPMRPSEIVQNTRNLEHGPAKDPNAWQVSHWMLWDNRYWVRVSLPPDGIFSALQIRPLQPSDIGIITRQLPDESKRDRFFRQKMLDAMQKAAPRNIRFTLPVLTYKEQIIALPTLSYKSNALMERVGLSGFYAEVYYNTFGLLDCSSSKLRIDHIA